MTFQFRIKGRLSALVALLQFLLQFFPLFLLLGLRWLPFAQAALIAAALFGVLGLLQFLTQKPWFAAASWLMSVACWAGGSFGYNQGMLFYPLLVNLGFLLWFGQSLLRPQALIETFARKMVADLSDAERAYCRRLTWVWCGFFIFNGAMAAATAWQGDLAWWAWYNGAIAYLLIGLLLGLEILLRYYKFRRTGTPLDRLLQKWLPPAKGEAPSAGARP